MNIFRSPKAQMKIIHRLEKDSGFSCGFIYIMEQYPYAKVGYATAPHKRLSSMQTGSPAKINLLCVAPGSLKLEQAIHRTLKDAGLSVRGEWYMLDDILHVFEALTRFTLAAIEAARGQPMARAEADNDAYYFQFQWCCHDHYASTSGLRGHLIADHQLSHEQADEMAKRYNDDPTLIGVRCRGECA